MDLISKLFDALSRTVGTPAVILVALAFIVLQFSDGAVKLFKANTVSVVPALGLFLCGVFVGFIQVLNSRFEVKAGRGLLEGLAAGVAAGVVGGVYYAACLQTGDAIRPDDTWWPAFARTFLATVVVCGIFGLTLSLCDPAAKFRWPERMAALVVLATGIMLPVGIGIGYYAEHWLPGRYISFPEIALMSAVFVTGKGIFPLARAGSGGRVFAVRFLGLGAFAALIAWLGLWWGRAVGDVALAFKDKGLVCSSAFSPLLKFANPITTPVAVLAIMTLVVSVSGVYFFMTTDNPITRLLAGRERRRSRAHTTERRPAR